MNWIGTDLFCVSPRILEVSFTTPEWKMIVFVCSLVVFFTGKRLLLDMKKWFRMGSS